MKPIPDLIDNQNHGLGEVLREILSEAEEPRLDVVSAYFNLAGLESLRPAIERLRQLRLLVGKEQDQRFVLGRRLREELQQATAQAQTTAAEIAYWQEVLGAEKVQIRRLERRFCHGKAYLVHGTPVLGAVGIVGSANFTQAGLESNLELCAVLKQTAAVEELRRWFDSLWNEAEDYKTQLLRLLEEFTSPYSPYEIYMKVLYEAMKDRLELELEENKETPSPIALADFQHDGYLAAKEILETYQGVLIADSVGLGKTYLALRLLDDYAYRQRQTALIVCPAAVEESVWRPRLQEHGIPYEIVSTEKLSRRDFPVEDYANRFRILVIDESHQFRNPQTKRWPNLFRLICKGLQDKKVILLTATPINNNIFDLYHQLRLISRDNRAILQSVGIQDLEQYFIRAEQKQQALYEVLEALAVRRSRAFIRQHYPEATIDGQKIRFPERHLHTVQYSLQTTYGVQLYQRLAQTIENLCLAPYQVDRYRRDWLAAQRARAQQRSLFEEFDPQMTEHLQQITGLPKDQVLKFVLDVGRQIALGHIMRMLYLKRLESSVEALRLSLQRLQQFLNLFLQALNQGRLLRSEDYSKLFRKQIEEEDDPEQPSLQIPEENLATLPELSPEEYDVEALRKAVEADLNNLATIVQQLEHQSGDEKLRQLKETLLSADLRDKKVVVFSSFRDTAQYLYEKLAEDKTFLQQLGRRRIELIHGGVDPQTRVQRIRRFAPKANGQPAMPPENQIDVLLSTDVLSEGQNLQDGQCLINYDLHWNPIRLVQRIGRLDRIGSPHSTIYVYNFVPEKELEDLLRLVARLREKLDTINRHVGLDASVLGETPNPIDFNTLRRLAQADGSVLTELESQSELNLGEFLQQDLLRFLKEIGEQRLQQIPLGMGTARKGEKEQRGFFAAFRNTKTNQHHWLFEDEQNQRILDRRLEAIEPIRSDPSEPSQPLPKEFDPRPRIQKLRRRLWTTIRNAELRSPQMPSPQRQIIHWLHSLPAGPQRNQLLRYFESRPVVGPAQKELRKLWREKTLLSQQQLLNHLEQFANTHPHPPNDSRQTPPAPEPSSLQEEDLECIAWMLVL